MYKLFLFTLFFSTPSLIVHGSTKTTTATSTTNAKQILLTPNADIKEGKFQNHFIVELNQLVDKAAGHHLNILLNELRIDKDYAIYAKKIEKAASSTLLIPKIVYLKQLLDIKQDHNVENFYTLRNLNFLNKLKLQLLKFQEESSTELRNLRWYNLCREFWFRDDWNYIKTTTTTTNNNTNPPSPNTNYWSTVKLAPLQVKTINATTTTTNTQKVHINIEQFGNTLYKNIKSAGSEIIDDYLLTVRKLLQEVIEQKYMASEEEEVEMNDMDVLHATKLTKLLKEIDAILAISDFYDKRNRLYTYLENDLSTDYEQFKNSQNAHEELAVILAKLQNKGLDLFVMFIFSNFEFLEYLHETWAKLLPELTAESSSDIMQQLQYDVMSQRLFDVNRLYVEFKNDWENNERYEAYQSVVKQLYEDTRNGSANMHVFQLLHNAAANVGSVTLNMIKGKCDEL